MPALPSIPRPTMSIASIPIMPARSKRSQIAQVLSVLAKVRPAGRTDVARSLVQLGAMLRHRSLVMLFSDLLTDPQAVRGTDAVTQMVAA